jgi:hypothetical protein
MLSTTSNSPAGYILTVVSPVAAGATVTVALAFDLTATLTVPPVTSGATVIFMLPSYAPDTLTVAISPLAVTFDS